MSARGQGDGFSMLIFVHVAHRVKTSLELLAVCGETNHGEDEAVVGANPKDFGIIARVDRVAIGGASVARKYGEVTAAYA